MAKQQKKVDPKKDLPATTDEGGDLVMMTDQRPDYIRQDDVRGTEKLGLADLIIPRLEIVQGLSPAVKPGDPGYIKGAEQGMLNNSVTRYLYGDSVRLVPVHYAIQYLVWRDRKAADAHNKSPAGKANKVPTDGFFGAYMTQDEAQKRADEEGGDKQFIGVIDTPTHLCLLIDFKQGRVEEIMVSMPRTKAKISRQWNTMVKLAGGPRFGRVYEATTVLTKNDQGDFYNFNIAQIGFPAKRLYERAEKLYKQIDAGKRKIVMDVSDLAHQNDDGAQPGAEM